MKLGDYQFVITPCECEETRCLQCFSVDGRITTDKRTKKEDFIEENVTDCKIFNERLASVLDWKKLIK